VVVSQDHHLGAVTPQIGVVANEPIRWVKMASAFPASAGTRRRERGIKRPDRIPIDRATREGCLDPRDYRPDHP